MSCQPSTEHVSKAKDGRRQAGDNNRYQVQQYRHTTPIRPIGFDGIAYGFNVIIGVEVPKLCA